MFFVEILEYPTPPSPELRTRHQSYVREQAQNGRLVLAGRFTDISGGLIIWKVNSREEAETIATHDPYAQNYATYQLKEWSYVPEFDHTTRLQEK